MNTGVSENSGTSSTATSTESGPTRIHDHFPALDRDRERERDEFQTELAAFGGPARWLEERAPRLLELYAGPWPEKLVLEETRAGFMDASARLDQCRICPPYGGACARIRSAIPEGSRVSLTKELMINHAPCDRWQKFRRRRRAVTVGIPSMLLDEGMREDPIGYGLDDWVASVTDRRLMPSVLLTRGEYTERTKLLARLCYQTLDLDVEYTWAPKLATQMKEHLDGKRPESPFERMEEARVLFVDFFDPKGPKSGRAWSDWFVTRVDGMLFERMSRRKMTVLSSSESLEALRSVFEQSAGFFDPLVVDVGRKKAGRS